MRRTVWHRIAKRIDTSVFDCMPVWQVNTVCYWSMVRICVWKPGKTEFTRTPRILWQWWFHSNEVGLVWHVAAVHAGGIRPSQCLFNNQTVRMLPEEALCLSRWPHASLLLHQKTYHFFVSISLSWGRLDIYISCIWCLSNQVFGVTSKTETNKFRSLVDSLH